MVYLNLHDTVPGVDLVDPVVAINNNWDQIDSKFKLLDSGASAVGTGAVNPETGMEFSASGLGTPDVGVWDGAAYTKITTSETWGAWQSITLPANFNTVISGKTPQLRLGSQGRKQLRGAVQYQAGATAWPAGFSVISSAQFVDVTYAPSTPVYRNLPPGPITGTTGTSWGFGQARVQSSGGFLNIALSYIGSIAVSGNYLDLAGVNWYGG